MFVRIINDDGHVNAVMLPMWYFCHYFWYCADLYCNVHTLIIIRMQDLYLRGNGDAWPDKCNISRCTESPI